MKKILFCITAFVCSALAYAQNVMPDVSFGNQGIVITDNTMAISKSAILPNGKIVSFGRSEPGIAPISHSRLVQYLQDGSLDTSFGVNGMVTPFLGDQLEPSSMIIQPDHKILINCFLSIKPPGLPSHYITVMLRYNSNGSIDSSFGTNGVVRIDFNDPASQNFLSSIALLPDGKIIVGGNYGYGKVMVICRFNPDGNFDQTFGNNGFVMYSWQSGFRFIFLNFAPASDGSIFCCGYNDAIKDGPRSSVLKLKANGKIDRFFGNNGEAIFNIDTQVFDGSGEYFDKIRLLANGNILLKGRTNNYSHIVALLPDGTPNMAFADGGFIMNIPVFNDIAVLEDERILTSGHKALNGKQSSIITRYKSNGTLDLSFNTTGSYDFNISGYDESLHLLDVYSDGRLLLSGSQRIGVDNNPRFALARLNVGAPVTITEDDFTPQTITVYPNPFSNEIRFRSDTEVISKVTIHDVSGRKIKELAVPGQSVAIDVPAGIYTCTIVTAKGKTYIRKIVKQ